MAPLAKAKQVPITREFLAAFYSQHPLEQVPEELEVCIRQVEVLGERVACKASPVHSAVGMPTPTRIDDCFWRNRQLCEDLAQRLRRVPAACHAKGDLPQTLAAGVQACCEQLVSGEAILLTVQNANVDKVATMVRRYLPTGLRGQIMEAQRARTERLYSKAVEDLVRKGGSIRAKYDLYLSQQWERRESLAALANTTGIYKLLIKYVGGIPDELMDFAKEINAKQGPMEEQRLAYGPELYLATELAIKLNVALALWLENPGALSAEETREQLQHTVLPAAHMYVTQVVRIVRHIGAVFHDSPFFITSEEASAAQAAAALLPPDRHSCDRRSSQGGHSDAGSLGRGGSADHGRISYDAKGCRSPGGAGGERKDRVAEEGAEEGPGKGVSASLAPSSSAATTPTSDCPSTSPTKATAARP